MNMKAMVVIALIVCSQIVYTDFSSTEFTPEEDAQPEDIVIPALELLPDVSSGRAPLTVHFQGRISEAHTITALEWDFQGDGVFEEKKELSSLDQKNRLTLIEETLKKSHTFTEPGIYHVLLRATNDTETTVTTSVTIQVYSERPWLDITPGKDAFMARAGYEAFFPTYLTSERGISFELDGCSITYFLPDQYFAPLSRSEGIPQGQKIVYENVYPGIHVQYTVSEDLLLEEFIVSQPVSLSSVEQHFTLQGVEYTMEDGGIFFYRGDDLIFSIPRPVMYELHNPQNRSYDIHYEIIEDSDHYILKKVIDDDTWLQAAQYPIIIDSTTQGEIADPWEQQGLTPYGQYFKNVSEYIDPLTGHLTIRHTDYSLSGRGLDLTITRVYSTVVAYKQDESGSGQYVPIATYQEAPTDLGCGWRLDFPWMEVTDSGAGTYYHLNNATQVKTNFQNGVWNNEAYGFVIYAHADNTYTKYRDNGLREEYDDEGRIVSLTDLNNNIITFSYGQHGISSITDTVGRTVTFTYSAGTLTSITDGTRTTTYSYAGDKLISVRDPLGRTTTYEYLPGNSFLITEITYPTGGFSAYEYTAVTPESAKIAPYKSSLNEDGETAYYLYTVDSPDTVTWTDPRDITGISLSGQRPSVFQRDDGTLLMYFKDKYVWAETVWKCVGGDCWEETITHTEYWIKRSLSADQHHWSTPQNVVQVTSTTGNPAVIEKQDGSYIMYYKDKYVWTEEECYWDRWLKEWVCETTTHTEYWIYRRSSADGLTWSSPIKIQKTTYGVRNISAIQKQDGTFLLCYTDRTGSIHSLRQKTSADGVTWSAYTNIVTVPAGTGNPALLQTDSGTVYVAYRSSTNTIQIMSNSGSGWSAPVQTPAVTPADPALLSTDTDIIILYKGNDNHCYRTSSTDGLTWSQPSQIAPNALLTDPATVSRTDRFYRVTTHYLSESALNLVKKTDYSYTSNSYLSAATDILISDAQTLRSSIHFTYDSKGRPKVKVSRDAQGIQTEKIQYTYNSSGKIISQDVYAGSSTDISYTTHAFYDNHGNITYTRTPEGATHFYSYANSSSENRFTDSAGTTLPLFSDAFYPNTIPQHCHTLVVGEAFINKGVVTEVYYQYDLNGNLTETKTLYKTRDYAVFTGTFSESVQTAFDIDASEILLNEGILLLSAVPTPTLQTVYETHSESGKGWLNTGTWQNSSFMADYTQCYTTPEPDCFSGQTEIGPFTHYPGTPNYTGYTTWLEENIQYVKTAYTAHINEYPAHVHYTINGGDWTTITSNLSSGTAVTTIPQSEFIQGTNTLQFQESSTHATQFTWTLYIDQGSTPEEYITSLSYDNHGNTILIIDALGNPITFGYDSNHTYLTSISNALNQTVSATYDLSTGLISSITDPKGFTSSYEYDILGRVTKKIHPDLTELEAIYDDLTNSVTIYDELDNYSIYYFDGLNRSIKKELFITQNEKVTEIYTYNYLNKLESKTDAGGHVFSYVYDSLGRLTKIVNPDLTYKEIHYFDNSQIVTVLDENHHKKEYSSDWTGNLLSVKEYIDSSTYFLTHYSYDDQGNMLSFTDANQSTTQYSYDSLFGMTEISYPDSTTETYTYDAVGNLIQRIDGNGTTFFTYNEIYQLITILYPDSSTVSFEYDENGNRILMTDTYGENSYTFDNRNRPISESRTIETQSFVIEYEYDAASRLISMTYPDQTAVTYEYDSLNRLTAISGYAHFEYNEDSLLSSMNFANGITTTFHYDDCKRPLTIEAHKSNMDLLNLTYHYDPVGNISQLEYNRKTTNQEWRESAETFQYDWLDRLIGAQGDYGSLSYTYDPAGNRLSRNDLTYTYNEMNELLSISDGTTFSYDSMGNVRNKQVDNDTFFYEYNSQNQLAMIKKDQHILSEFEYNGDGHRIKKTEWAEHLQDYQTIISVYSGTKVIYEKNMNTGQDAIFICSHKGKIAKRVGDLIDYYHIDHLGSTRLKTDESGDVIAEITYQPFGKSFLSGDEESYLFNGKEKDSSDLYYFGARYYDTDTGRFITRDSNRGDPINPLSLNRYVFCLCNPIKYLDPLGMEEKDPSEMSEEELKEYFRSLFENGLTLGEIMDMLSDFIDEIMEANGLGDILNSILDLEIDIIMEAFKPILNILAALADVANEYIDNFEGVVIELMASGGALLGGTYGLSFVYSTTLSGDGWKAFKFFGVGGTTPGFSAMVGIGAFFWHPNDGRNFKWRDWEGLFIDYSGSGGIGIANIGVQLFASGTGEIRGGMLMIGAGIPGISGNLNYYWPHDEEFSWLKFLGAF